MTKLESLNKKDIENLNFGLAKVLIKKLGVDCTQIEKEFGVKEGQVERCLFDNDVLLGNAIINYCMEDEYFRVLVSNFVYDKIKEHVGGNVPEDKFHHVKLLKL